METKVTTQIANAVREPLNVNEPATIDAAEARSIASKLERADGFEADVGRAMIRQLVRDGRVASPVASTLSALSAAAPGSGARLSAATRYGESILKQLFPDEGRDPQQVAAELGLELTEDNRLTTTAQDVPVRLSVEAGDYYCDHAFFDLSTFGANDYSSLRQNAEGENLLGFLHVPPLDSGLDDATVESALDDVVGAGLDSFIDSAAQSLEQEGSSETPVRVLLTGFEPFGGHGRNPTGELVDDPARVDALMASATGASLVSEQSTPTNRVYTIPQDDGTTREVHLRLVRLPVDDDALSTLPDELEAWRPHAALSLGVHSTLDFAVETIADDGNIVENTDGTRRDGYDQPENVFEPNGALARAMP